MEVYCELCGQRPSKYMRFYRGGLSVQVCAICSVSKPIYSTQEKAVAAFLAARGESVE